MKKLICLVLAVLLTLSAVSVFAEGYTDKDTVNLVYAESDGYLAAQQIQEAIEANKTPSEDAGL